MKSQIYPNLESVISNVIDGLIASKTMFTSYDVTLLVRQQGEFAKHPTVRNVVREVMSEKTTYRRALRTFGLAALPAFVYHPENSDVAMYDYDAIKNQIATPAPVPVPVNNKPPVAPSKPKVNIDGKVVKLHSRNRLCVPANVIRSLGLKNGDKAYFTFDGDNVIVTAAYPVGKTARAVTVDRYDNAITHVPSLKNTFVTKQSGVGSVTLVAS